MTPESCPNCGADLPRHAKACPECGSCEQTGWSEDAKSDALGLPDDSFDYEQYVKREFGPGEVRPRSLHPLWWVTAVVLLLAWVTWLFWR
ncbi:MAG: zinc ribbon domain-containing protein [Verrucomicrobia bacterium]|nr:zinc ribbon domain-containing protein [Verrucomicrobiota bacterium]